MAIKALNSITIQGSSTRYVIPKSIGNFPVVALTSAQTVKFYNIDIETGSIDAPVTIEPFASDSSYYYYRMTGFGDCVVTDKSTGDTLFEVNISEVKVYKLDGSGSNTGGGSSGGASWHTVWEGSKSVTTGTYKASDFSSSVDFSRPTKFYGSISGASGGGGPLQGSKELTPGIDSETGGGSTTETQSISSDGKFIITRSASITVSITTDELLSVSCYATKATTFIPTGGSPNPSSTESQSYSAYISKIEQYY